MLKERDIRQRTLGFISFSFLAHLGLIAATFLIPNVLKEGKQGSNSETYLVESSTPASLGESAQAVSEIAPAIEQPAQVITAPVDDTSAVVVAKAELPQKAEIKAAAKVIKPAREKNDAATKKVLALPAKKSLPAKLPAKASAKVETVDQSELEVNQALKAARESEESLPEVAADIEVPEVNEQAQEQAAVATEEVTEQSQEATEAVESATTTGTEASESTEEESASVTPAVQAAPAAQAAPAPQPLYAPIQRGAQLTRPAGQANNQANNQIGGLGTAGAPATQGAPTGAGAVLGNGGAGGAIRDADSLMEQPGNAKPNYAAEDQRAGRQGMVVFDAIVTREGTVQGIQMKQSSGFSSLDSSAYEAFKRHRYLPGQQGAVRKKFQFVLNGEEVLKGRLRRK